MKDAKEGFCCLLLHNRRIQRQAFCAPRSALLRGVRKRFLSPSYLVLYISLFYEEAAMFWAGMIVGLILGIPLGILIFSSMASAKRSQDELDKAVSAIDPTPTP